jgi:hypothetical protein
LFNDNQKLTDLLARFTEVPAPTVATGQSTAHVPDALAPAGGLAAIFGAVPSASTSGTLAPAPVRTVPGFKAYSSIREYFRSVSLSSIRARFGWRASKLGAPPPTVTVHAGRRLCPLA